jgi:hypothetical protein
VTNSRSLVLWTALAMSPGICSKAQAQTEQEFLPTPPPSWLSIGIANSGQHLSATVGQQIEITLWAIGGASYGEPQISSPAVRQEETAMGPPNPGGPISIFIFEAAAEGEAEINVPFFSAMDRTPAARGGFAVTIRVGPAPGNLRKRIAPRSLDQENDEPWDNEWIGLDYVRDPGVPPKSAIRVLSQTFVPRLSRLTAIDVELAVAKPGQSTGDVEMELVNEHQVLADVWRTVSVADSDHVLFILPNGGMTVAPGQVYSIRLESTDGVFGWKYVVGGYAKGTASNERKPLLQDGRRCTFLFRTFGGNCVTGKNCDVSALPEK